MRYAYPCNYAYGERGAALGSVLWIQPLPSTLCLVGSYLAPRKMVVWGLGHPPAPMLWPWHCRCVAAPMAAALLGFRASLPSIGSREWLPFTFGGALDGLDVSLEPCFPGHSQVYIPSVGEGIQSTCRGLLHDTKPAAWLAVGADCHVNITDLCLSDGLFQLSPELWD